MKGLPKCLEKYTHMIDSVSDERGSDNGYWVYLRNGWTDGESHIIHEDTLQECVYQMKAVVRCRGKCCAKPR